MMSSYVSVMSQQHLCGPGNACLHALVPTTGLLLTISAFLAALFYLYSKFTENPQLEAWAKLEVAEIINTLAILVVTVMLIKAFCVTPVTFFAPHLAAVDSDFTHMNMFSAAVSLLESFADNCKLAIKVTMTLQGILSLMCLVGVNMSPIGMGVSVTPLRPIMDVISASFSMAYMVMSLGYITVIAQIHVLNLTQMLFISFLLPIGFALRSFTPTRKFGGSLIALGLVFIIFYPILVILFYQTITSTSYTEYGGISTKDVKQMVNAGNSVGSPSTPKSSSTIATLPTRFTDWLSSRAWLSSLIIWVVGVGVAEMFLGGVFFPMLMTIIIIAGARQLTRTLGEELDITNITRMI